LDLTDYAVFEKMKIIERLVYQAGSK